MNAQLFLEQFSYIINTPKGIQQLREIIYQLAITGALTTQLHTDGDSRELLVEIENFKKRLIQKKAYKRLIKLESETLHTPPNFPIPDSWEWTRLLDIGEINPKNNVVEEHPASFIPMSGIPENYMGPLITKEESWGKIKKSFTHFKNGDVVLAKITPCFENGKAAVIENLDHVIGAGSTELYVFRPIHPNISSKYIYLLLKSPFFVYESKKNMTGTAGLKRLPLKYFATRALPLPPFPEQLRIIAKVDELMALCDQLEKQLQKSRKLQNTLRNSILKSISNSISPDDFKTNWRMLENSFNELFQNPEDVTEFKKLILDLAISGKLLNVNHYSANNSITLLNAITSKRIKWNEEATNQEKKESSGMLKKLRSHRIKTPEIYLPEHWTWASLLQISQAIIDCHNKTAPYINSGIHLIRTSDIRNGRIDLTKTKKISEETYIYWSKRMPPRSGDIIFTREAPIGEAAIIPDNVKVCLGQRTMLIRVFPEFINNRFLLYVMQSPSFHNHMSEAAIGLTVKHLRVGSVEELVVPVPPKAEQDHIVSIIDKLFEICDQYIDQLKVKIQIANNLATCALSNITGFSIEQKEKAMKAPQTELISLLRLGNIPDIKVYAPLATILARHNNEMNAKDLWQRFGSEIDNFYTQLKVEINNGWILEPNSAEMREKLVK